MIIWDDFALLNFQPDLSIQQLLIPRQNHWVYRSRSSLADSYAREIYDCDLVLPFRMIMPAGEESLPSITRY